MTIRILVVDDEVVVREMLSRHFRYLGFEVRTAGGGEEALEVMAAEKIDIVITDVVMPGMDGIELLRAINSLYPMMRVVIITGCVSFDNALACMRLGADAFVLKPLNKASELDSVIEKVVDNIKSWVDILRGLQEIKHEGNKV